MKQTHFGVIPYTSQPSPSGPFTSRTVHVPYNFTVKEDTYIHMTRMKYLYLSITKKVIFFAFISSYDYHKSINI